MENTPKRKGNYPIPRNEFFFAWMLTFQKKLKEEYDIHKESCILSGCDPVSYESFCDYAFMREPREFEHRDN